jgi:hypothetical protein
MTTAVKRRARARRIRAGAAIALFAGVLTQTAPASVVQAVGNESGFEDDDGNLAPNPAGLNFDWNSFAPLTWTGTAPTRTSEASASGWSFTGVEDARAVTSDSAFAGGTKQDADCATVGTQKASNKDDLIRVYFASNTVNDHVYLNLAWVRIPQNTTSSSAHVAFEFNQGTTPCPAGSDSLVRRSTANGGDMLIVYDFEGGAATPTIRLSRWIATGTCEVGSNSPPCWGVAQTLGAGVAEAAVNVGTPVQDGLAPPPATLPVTLNDSEFGEAGIDLTDAGVFPPGECVNFGQGFAVSRSSGNSSQAQMKDLVGPGEVNIQNCGSVIIHKVTVPSPDPTDTTFDYTTTGGLDPATFQLKDGDTQDYGGTVLTGDYTVTETDPGPNWMTSLDCSASETDDGSTFTVDQATRTVSFNLQPLDTIECTYTNTLQLGAIKILKTSSKDDSALAGAEFDVRRASDNGLVAHVTTDANGEACVDGLTFGGYTVTETAAPTGYSIDDPSTRTITVDNNASCGDVPYVGEETSFSDTPLSEIQVLFRSLAGPGVTNASIDCVVPAVSENGDPDPATDDTDETFTNLSPGTYTCTVVVDP